MGRMAAHTGQIVTYDDMLNCEHEFAPEVDKLKMDSPAPLQPAPTASIPCRSRAARNANTKNDPASRERNSTFKVRRRPRGGEGMPGGSLSPPYTYP